MLRFVEYSHSQHCRCMGTSAGICDVLPRQATPLVAGFVITDVPLAHNAHYGKECLSRAALPAY